MTCRTRWWFQIFCFNFDPHLGKWSTLTNLFQMGWFNHQPAKNWSCFVQVPIPWRLWAAPFRLMIFFGHHCSPPKKQRYKTAPPRKDHFKRKVHHKVIDFQWVILPWKFNIALENRPSQKGRIVFIFQPSFLQGQAVRLWGCITPWKINGWNLQITGHWKGKSSEPNLHDYPPGN